MFVELDITQKVLWIDFHEMFGGLGLGTNN